ncbi:toxin Doc [mine drainage metagenome]|jgi:prophage maintenance system killer protein|uniref:Toxin Doc n=1 Tax=mine drainage metagenome TaxID=410659 RepID=A0A1J5QIK7_9ZZZZ
MTEIAIYQSTQGRVEVRVDRETVWLSQRQMAELFETSTDNIGLHLKRIYADAELDEAATTEKSSVVRQEGSRHVKRWVKHYNLDAIISVGYRVNSKKGVQFRQWATTLLRTHLSRGYTINTQRFDANARELEAALQLIRRAAHSDHLALDAGRGLIDLVSRYTRTFLWLQRYDEGLLSEPPSHPGGVLPSLQQAREHIATLKRDLRSRGDASDLFAQERGDGLAAILGNLEQTVFGEDAYPDIESKAAHLLYFVVKNHPFADGNKRSAALLFVDFLHRNNRLVDTAGHPVINDVGLAALTLLVAESDPKDKDILIRLIMHMIGSAPPGAEQA